MFIDALPLPTKPNLERYKKLAKDLTSTCRNFNAGETKAIANWSENWIEGLLRAHNSRSKVKQGRGAIDRKIDQVERFATRKLTGTEGQCRLIGSQFVIARAHGFESWSKFAKHVIGLSDKTSGIARFEAAVDAIVSGDVKKLNRLLRQDPKLVQMRSTREHRSMLLHYVGANGVEGYRQLTPQNAVEIAELLLKAGADVNSEADLYGGGSTTLGLVATSVHPEVAGVQKHLIQVLLDHGAEIDHTTSAGNQQNAVMGCLANGQFEAAVYLAEHGAQLTFEAATGLGRLDVVKGFFKEDGKLKRGVKRKELVSGFLYACGSGQNKVVQFLLDKGVSPNMHRGDGQTATHWAAIGGQLETMKLLLKYKPKLEARNVYGGSVLGQTLWSAAHGGDPKVYARIIETLIAAGAKVPERHVPVNEEIDNLLHRYGSEPEPTWYWFGEKPRK